MPRKISKPDPLRCAKCGGSLASGYIRDEDGDLCMRCREAKYAHSGPTPASDAAIREMRRMLGPWMIREPGQHSGDWVRPDQRERVPGEDDE